MKQYIASEGDTVDYIAWRAYGVQARGVVEQVLEANHGMADLGPELPVGTVVMLPEIDTTQAHDGVRLWD